MSIRVMTQVWANSNHKGSALILMLAIADFSDDSGYAHPGIETLADKCRMSERNTRYVIEQLVASGELEVKKNTGRSGTNEYWITIDQTLPLFEPKGAKRERVQSLHPGKTASERVQPSVGKGAIAIAPEPSLTKREPSGKDTRAPARPEWLSEETWSRYVAHRKAKRAPLTDEASRLLFLKLTTLREAGQDPAAVIDQSIENGWTGLFELRGSRKVAKGSGARGVAADWAAKEDAKDAIH